MAENEIRIGKMVAELPGSEEYFVTPESTCTVSALEFPSTVAAGCKPLTGDVPTTQLVVMRMRDVPHYKLGLTPPGGSLDDVRNTLRNIIVGLPHCLQAVVLLQAAPDTGQPIVHFDLKADNIFAPDLPKLPLIADFGISFLPLEQTFERAAELVIAYEPGYYVWPPEVHLLAYLLHADRPNGPDAAATDEELAGVAMRVAASNPMAAAAGDQGRIDARYDEVFGFYSSLHPATAQSVYSYVMGHWDKIDLYSLCMCFGTIMGAYGLNEDDGQLAPVAQALHEGTRADPERRPLLGQLLAVSRRAISGSSETTISGLTIARNRAEQNRRKATVTLRAADRRLARTAVRLDAHLAEKATHGEQ